MYLPFGNPILAEALSEFEGRVDEALASDPVDPLVIRDLADEAFRKSSGGNFGGYYATLFATLDDASISLDTARQQR